MLLWLRSSTADWKTSVLGSSLISCKGGIQPIRAGGKRSKEDFTHHTRHQLTSSFSMLSLVNDNAMYPMFADSVTQKVCYFEKRVVVQTTDVVQDKLRGQVSHACIHASIHASKRGRSTAVSYRDTIHSFVCCYIYKHIHLVLSFAL